MNKIFSQSKDISHEYCCTIVRIGEVTPVPNSDFLGSTLVNGLTIVVRKDEVKPGDVMFYAANETQLNEKFLGVNNQYRKDDAEGRNVNYAEMISESDPDKQKTMVGFFDKNSRVRMIKLKGCPSMGYLFGIDAMAKFCPEVRNVNLEEMIGEDFDMVNGELFIKAYVPYKAPCRSGGGTGKVDKTKKYDRMIPGQFAFHYDTEQLNRNMEKLHPTDSVTISVKVHGTSAIFGKVKVKVPFRLQTKCNVLNKVFNALYSKLPIEWQRMDVGYDNIYSSRTVIKNSFINPSVTKGYYNDDVWAEYNEILKNYIPDGMTVYGEICGYLTGSSRMIQKDYDYGCKEGTNKFMPYRITTKTEMGGVYEWSVEEVKEWTEGLINIFKGVEPQWVDRIMPITILYHGRLADLYPNLSLTNHWHENALEKMKSDKNWFMEKNEPMCQHKVPREGVVLRIDGDEVAEAFKLKCLKFLGKEAELVDAGEVDIEMEQAYGESVE